MLLHSYEYRTLKLCFQPIDFKHRASEVSQDFRQYVQYYKQYLKSINQNIFSCAFVCHRHCLTVGWDRLWNALRLSCVPNAACDIYRASIFENNRIPLRTCKVLMYCTRISVVFNPQAHETGDFRCVVLQRRERARVFENKRLWASDRFSSLPTTYRYSSRFFASDCPLERLMCWPLDSRAAAFDIDIDILLRTAVELRIFERLQSFNSEWHSDSLIHR